MPNCGVKDATKHYDAYPEGAFHPLLAYGFRLIYILLPAYLAISMVLWGLVWSGTLNLPFMQNLLAWHTYEMMFGAASAGMIGFILTAVPELHEDVVPVVGKPLLGIVLLWVLGRAAFWLMDVVGVYLVALSNIPLLLWVTALIVKPVFLDPMRRNVSLAVVFIGIVLIQAWFFTSMAGWVRYDFMSILKVALGAFMVLELLALRRITTEAINLLLQDDGIDEPFIARAPSYNISILCVSLFTAVEFFLPNNIILGWLGLGVAAAILSTLNDFFIDEASIIFRSYVFPLFLILLLMALGYGTMGLDYLVDDFYAINHFRHFLTSGVFGLSLLMVMVIVATIHTGRALEPDPWVSFSVLLIILATLLRTMIPFAPDYASALYLGSALIWSLPFILYLLHFYSYLSRPRVDGLPG